MDVLTVVFFSLLSAGSTGALVAYNVRQTTSQLPRRREPVVYTKYLLPPPGQKFELYTRAKEVMDGLVHDKCVAEKALEASSSALEESQSKLAELESDYERVVAENKRLVAKIELAQELVRSFTHSGMKIRLPAASHGTSERVVTIG